MRSIEVTAAIIFLGGFAPTWAEETLLSITIESCEGDVARFCSNVKPGEGRLLHCLFSNDDKISTGCADALQTASMNMEAGEKEWSGVMEACDDDFERFCPTKDTGDGRILRCLTHKVYRKDGVSRYCVMTLEGVGLK